MTKSAEAFRSIGEVARLIGVQPHVLRYWEGQFPQLSPVKRADGRRYYRPDDVRLAAGLCLVMRDEGMSARGASLLMAADKGVALRARGAERLAQLLETEPTALPARSKTPRARTQPAPRARTQAAPQDRTQPDLAARAARPVSPPLAQRLAKAHRGLQHLPRPAHHRAVLDDVARHLRGCLSAR